VTIAEHKYDALGRRVRKVVTNKGGLNGTTRFLWGGVGDWQCLEELDGSDDIVARYTYAPGYIDAVAVQERDLNADNDFADDDEVVYYHSSTLYSVYALSDANETVIERYRYDAYGACTVLDADGSVDGDGLSDVKNPYLFTARRLDTESALMQYRFREYSPGFGRFSQRDPVRHPLLNVYAYGGQNPVSAVDPLGLFFGLLLGGDRCWKVSERTVREGYNGEARIRTTEYTTGLLGTGYKKVKRQCECRWLKRKRVHMRCCIDGIKSDAIWEEVESHRWKKVDPGFTLSDPIEFASYSEYESYWEDTIGRALKFTLEGPEPEVLEPEPVPEEYYGMIPIHPGPELPQLPEYEDPFAEAIPGVLADMIAEHPVGHGLVSMLSEAEWGFLRDAELMGLEMACDAKCRQLAAGPDGYGTIGP